MDLINTRELMPATKRSNTKSDAMETRHKRTAPYRAYILTLLKKEGIMHQHQRLSRQDLQQSPMQTK